MLRERREPPELERRELPEERRLLPPKDDIRREPLPLPDVEDEEDEDLLRDRLRER